MQANKAERAHAEKEHQEKLLKASLEIAEQERQTIAVNLHDEVGLNLSILKLNFNKLHQSSDDPELAENILATSFALIEDSIETVRGIHNDIRPRTLMALGLVPAIRELAREINVSRTAEVIVAGGDLIKIREKDIELQLHRLIKEVLNNTLRHSKPTFIEINIENVENTLRVIILHNGMGVSTEKIKEFAKKSTGLGLKSIFTRLGLLNAEIEFYEQKEGTSQVVIKYSLV